jgi:hypothetical protein
LIDSANCLLAGASYLDLLQQYNVYAAAISSYNWAMISESIPMICGEFNRIWFNWYCKKKEMH